jgi:UDP-glucose 4-epimerase
MKWFVTGAAGFIGSNLVDRLLSLGHEVVGYDNFSTGRREFLQPAGQQARFRLVEGDVLDLPALTRAMDGCDTVAHLAANADVRFGTDHPRKDLEQNTLATWNVLEAMRHLGVRRLLFTSTGSIYGESAVIPTPEDAPLPIQTSLYGASKMAAEGLACAYAEGFGLQVFIFRFVSMLGHRYTHGHVFDFYRQLQEHPDHLHILGDGHQRKSYLDVQDCLDGVLLALEKSDRPVNIFNVGDDEYCEVNDSVGWITEHLGLRPKLTYGGGQRGWIGDNPFIFLDCARLRGLGWNPKLTIRQGVIETLRFLQAQPELMK